MREVMWDGIDCHRCRMLGWIACSWDEPELRFVHLRPMGQASKAFMQGACVTAAASITWEQVSFLWPRVQFLGSIRKPYVLESIAIIMGVAEERHRNASRVTKMPNSADFFIATSGVRSGSASGAPLMRLTGKGDLSEIKMHN